MIKVENVEVWGFEHAVRGCRNPMNSWNKSDSVFTHEPSEYTLNGCIIGSNDIDLMRRLYKAGTEHRKYLRQIFVSMDITAPFYLWKQIDTYKVGTTSNSCSTMHKLCSKPITLSDFSFEGFDLYGEYKDDVLCVVDACEKLRKGYNATKDPFYWNLLIRLLPEAYNQKRTITMNYENVVTIIKQRSGHKLKEWLDFIDELKQLPYIKEIMED